MPSCSLAQSLTAATFTNNSGYAIFWPCLIDLLTPQSLLGPSTPLQHLPRCRLQCWGFQLARALVRRRRRAAARRIYRPACLRRWTFAAHFTYDTVADASNSKVRRAACS